MLLIIWLPQYMRLNEILFIHNHNRSLMNQLISIYITVFVNTISFYVWCFGTCVIKFVILSLYSETFVVTNSLNVVLRTFNIRIKFEMCNPKHFILQYFNFFNIIVLILIIEKWLKKNVSLHHCLSRVKIVMLY